MHFTQRHFCRYVFHNYAYVSYTSEKLQPQSFEKCINAQNSPKNSSNALKLLKITQICLKFYKFYKGPKSPKVALKPSKLLNFT